MLSLKVNFDDAAAKGGIAALKALAENRRGLHGVLATAVADGVADHLTALNSRSPNTNFYGNAASSVEHEATDAGAEVRVPHPGTALRYYGGTVTPGATISSFTGKPTTSLAIPTDQVPVVDRRRLSPREVGVLAFIPNRGKGSEGTKGYLVEGEQVINKQGKNKGATRIKAIKRDDGGRLMFILREFTTHEQDLSVMPSITELLARAVEAGEGYLESFSFDEGGAA